MKASKAEARKAIAAESQAQDMAEVHRKLDLVMAHLSIPNVPPDPAADAEVDRLAAEAAGDPEEQARIEARAAGSIPTREEALAAQAEEREAEKRSHKRKR